jgi:hypothetical protein
MPTLDKEAFSTEYAQEYRLSQCQLRFVALEFLHDTSRYH